MGKSKLAPLVCVALAQMLATGAGQAAAPNECAAKVRLKSSAADGSRWKVIFEVSKSPAASSGRLSYFYKTFETGKEIDRNVATWNAAPGAKFLWTDELNTLSNVRGVRVNPSSIKSTRL